MNFRHENSFRAAGLPERGPARQLCCFGGGGGSSSSGNTTTTSTSTQLGASDQANLTSGNQNVSSSSGIAQGAGASLNTGVQAATGATVTVNDAQAINQLVSGFEASLGGALSSQGSTISQVLDKAGQLQASDSSTTNTKMLTYLAIGVLALGGLYVMKRS